MSDVFISYSRKDHNFVEELRSRLGESGLDVWVDLEGLYAGEDFLPELDKAVDAAMAFVFVISPDSVASPFCTHELARAVDAQKRIVPVLYREVPRGQISPELAKRQWVYFRDDDDPLKAFADVQSAIRADWQNLRQHARLTVRAREWDAKGRQPSWLLRGRDLRDAEAWLETVHGGEVPPTTLHQTFVHESRTASQRRVQRIAFGVAVAIVTVLIASSIALGQRLASLNNLGLDDIARGRTEAAIDGLEEADGICAVVRRSFSGCSDVTMNLGRAYLDAERFEQAMDQFTRALDDATVGDPTYLHPRATALQNRSYARIMIAELHAAPDERLGQYELAERDLVEANRLLDQTERGSEESTTIVTMARIHLGRGELPEARAALERAARFIPESPEIELLLSVVSHCEGRGAASIHHFRKFTAAHLREYGRSIDQLDKDYYAALRNQCVR